MARTGILLLGFGGPDSLDAIGPFMRQLMGREPSPELIARVSGNYEAIGGKSPLAGIAADIAEGLASHIAETGRDVPVRVGMRYWRPYIADALTDLIATGCERIVTVSLSPFESKVASGAYREAIEETLAEYRDIEILEAPLISELDAFTDFLAEAAQVTLSGLAQDAKAVVAFTAHSLPMADLVDGDPYVSGLRDIASGIASRLGWEAGIEGAGGELQEGFSAFGSDIGRQPWYLVYQSKGQRPGEWLGPELAEFIVIASKAGVKAVAVCPIGFVTDHMETLFDLDIVAARAAAERGLIFLRAPVPNDDDLVVSAIARAIEPWL